MHYARCRGDWEGLLEYLLQRQEVRCTGPAVVLQKMLLSGHALLVPLACVNTTFDNLYATLHAHAVLCRRSVRWRCCAGPA